jgi:hypothetical protein
VNVSRWHAIAALLLMAGAFPSRSAAQMRSPQILTLGAGVSRFNFNGTDSGSTYVLIARFDGVVNPYLVVEPGLSFLSYNNNFGRVEWLLAELSVQGQVYAGPVRPFAGGGIGFANQARGPNISKLTLHATSGARIRLGGGWGLRLEGRLRAIDPFHSHTLDLTAGIMRVLPQAF